MIKYRLDDYVGNYLYDWHITGQKKVVNCKTLWEVICRCGTVCWCRPYLIISKEKCFCCKSCAQLGQRNSYQGTRDIPKTLLCTLKHCAKKRHLKDGGIPVEITLDDLQIQWDKQKGICALSGLSIGIGMNASVDRINSSLGYTVDNIQFVDKRINKMKMDIDEETFKFLCGCVSRDRGNI